VLYSERDIQEQREFDEYAEGQFENWPQAAGFDNPNFWMWTIGLEFHHHANDTSKWVKTCEGIELDDTCWPACLYAAEALMSCNEANRRGYVRV
jgi:hypothetical protein